MKPSSAAFRSGQHARTHTFFDSLSAHKRVLIGAAIVVLVLAAGAWLFARSREMRSENAARSLAEAQRAADAGNLALAQSDLERLVTRYAATPAAGQAILLLAQIHYDRGEYQKGIARLRELAGSTEGPLVAAANNLLGAGYEQLGKFREAAIHYRRAADRARFDAERQNYLASAARAYHSVGDDAAARRIWAELAEGEAASSVAAEARVRLGELNAQPVKRT